MFERKSVPPQFSATGLRLLALADAVLPQVEDAERDVARLLTGQGGQLRIAVECHTCFDWLMPAMDAFRHRWPEVELDIVSGFHADPVGLLHQDRADVGHRVRGGCRRHGRAVPPAVWLRDPGVAGQRPCPGGAQPPDGAGLCRPDPHHLPGAR